MIGGALVAGDTEIGKALFDRVKHVQGTCGAVPSPFDCFLTLRGIRSLGVRMAKVGRKTRVVLCRVVKKDTGARARTHTHTHGVFSWYSSMSEERTY